MIASSDFAFHELDAVVDQPADWSIFKTGGNGVFFCPADHTFGSVYMSDGSSRSRRSQCCASCVGEQVQNFNWAACLFDFFREPVPVGGLFREQTCMFETKRFQMKCEIFVMNGPLFRQIEEFPFSAAAGTAVIMTVHFTPSFMFFRSIPDNLRIGTYQKIVTPAFQFFTF